LERRGYEGIVKDEGGVGIIEGVEIVDDIVDRVEDRVDIER